MIELKPQPGPQTEFLSTPADICVYGGAAGGGKSFALLLEPVRHCVGDSANPRFTGVIFRRNAVQVRNPGGLWDESSIIYGDVCGADPKRDSLEWHFNSKAKMKFAHLEYDVSVLDWQGAQITYLGFDELTHFTEAQFWYMLSRNRSTSGIRPYVRATTNPDADSWVRRLLDWWIGPDGLPIPERSGKIRWFVRVAGEIHWGDSRQGLIDRFKDQIPEDELVPKTFTFISAKLSDNRILMEQDPGYRANILAMDRVERARLLDGNWNIRPSAGNFFRREYFPVLNQVNANIVRTVRAWDRAATKPSETNKDPDWTVGLKLGLMHTGAWIVLDVVRIRDTPRKVRELIRNTAERDGFNVPIVLEQEPGSSGVADIDDLVRMLAGYVVRVVKPSKDKITRASPVSSQAEHGNVYVLKAAWNEAFFYETENFPPENDVGHDDQVDALSTAFNSLAQGASILDVLGDDRDKAFVFGSLGRRR